MKKLLLIVVAVLGMSTTQAQDMMKDPAVSVTFELNGGVLTHDSFFEGLGGIVDGESNHQIGQGSFGFEMDLFARNKFNFGPAAKLYFHETGYFGGRDASHNNYHGSIGLVAGIDAGKWSFNTSFESPTPDKRESIFEAVISPSAAFMISDKVGIKANFDYFVNKKLYNYAYSFGGGLIYKF